jgi:hypothetical protein
MFNFTLKDIVFDWCNNYMGDYLYCTFAELQLASCKRYKKVLNDEQVYLQLKNMKQEKNERVEAYYEKLLKLAKSLQHKITNSFLIIIFKYILQPYMCVAIVGMKRKLCSNIKK